MLRRIILKIFRVYIIVDKKSESFTFVHYLVIVAISAVVTASIKRFVTQGHIFDKRPASYIIYDVVEPQISLPIHEQLRQYDD